MGIAAALHGVFFSLTIAYSGQGRTCGLWTSG